MGVIVFDSQFDESAGVLRNSFGLRDAEKLEQKIANYSAIRVLELSRQPLIGKFDIAHLRRIHQHIFQDVFPWAGDFREVTTSRTNSFGFPPPQFLIPSLETLFAALKAEKHLAGLSPDLFAARAGHYLGELNAIHPFREGNGRSQREFIRSVALDAGHKLTWRNLSPAENNEASRVSYATGNHSGLAALIRERLS
jgi:cell filamentation protein